MKLKLLTVALATISSVSAVFSDEAYVVDWVKNPIGYLNSKNTVVANAGDELVIGTLTDSSVLASINVTDGSTIWRRWFKDNLYTLEDSDSDLDTNSSPSLVVKSNNGFNDLFVLSNNHQLLAFDPVTSINEWTTHFDDPITSINSFTSEKGSQIFVATKSGILYKLEPLTGSIIWRSDLEIDSIPIGIINLTTKIGVITSTSYLINVEKTTGEVHSRRKFGTVTSKFPRFLDDVLLVDDDSIIISKSGSRLVIRLIDSNGNVLVEEEVNLLREGGGEGINAVVDGGKLTVSSANKEETFTIKDGKIIRDTIIPLSSEPSPSISPILFLSNYKLAQDEFGYLSLYNKLLSPSPPIWSHHHGLTNIQSSLFVDFLSDDSSLSEEELLFEENADAVTAFIRRLSRHIDDLKYFIQTVKDTYISTSTSTSTTSTTPISSHTTTESNENLFGFHKLLIIANKYNHIYALDTTDNGNIVWKLKLPIPSSKSVKSLISDSSNRIYIIGSTGEVFIVDVDGNFTFKETLALKEHELVDQVIQHNGTIFVTSNDANIFTLTSLESDPLPLYFTKLSSDSTSLEGYYLSDITTLPQHTWKYSLGKDNQIVATAKRSPKDFTASIGKVLGDRRVLYKYLHRNSIALATYNSKAKSLTVSIIDSITGRLLHSKVHNDEIASTNINLIYGEHWIIYSFTSKLPSEGQKIVVWDLYESDIPNQRQSKDDEIYSSFDSYTLPHVKSQSYFFNEEPITSLSISRTRYGITSRDVILTLGSGKIATLPKILLDPRRPVGRSPTKEEQEEGLNQYNSVIFLPANNVISHSRYLLGINKIITEPATLESTSLIAGFGPVDLFFTRITPSRPFDMLSNSFDKNKLIFTIVTILTATTVVRKFAHKKSTDKQWGVGE